MKGLLLLMGAIAFEVAGTSCMKASEGMTRLWPTVLMGIFYIVTFILLSRALLYFEVGKAYAIWSGVGTAGIAVIGVLYFKEPVSAAKVVFLGLIIVGVVGLHLSSGAAESPAATP